MRELMCVGIVLALTTAMRVGGCAGDNRAATIDPPSAEHPFKTVGIDVESGRHQRGGGIGLFERAYVGHRDDAHRRAKRFNVEVDMAGIIERLAGTSLVRRDNRSTTTVLRSL